MCKLSQEIKSKHFFSRKAAAAVAIFLGYLSFLAPCVFADSSAAALSLKLEAIPSGVVLLFSTPPDLAERINHFKVFRSSDDPKESMFLDVKGFNPGRYQVAELNYYHDWYKDYFYLADINREFYYRVEAYDAKGNRLAVSEPAWVSWKVRQPPQPGVMLTPTAYRRVPMYDSPYSRAASLLPINIDLNASYYIGRLYSYNRLTQLTNTRSSLFTRIGVWFLQLDAKVVLEREGRYFPQLAIGTEASTMVRDTRQPTFQDPGIPAFSVKKESSRNFTGSFVAASKQMGWFRPTMGWVLGDSPSKVIYLTEFLAKESESSSGMFFSVNFQPTSNFGLEWELIQPLHAKESPYLINLQVGRALHTNFDLGYLGYSKGYEVLGHINFRFTLYPASGRKK